MILFFGFLFSAIAFSFHKEILEILMIPYREIMGEKAKLQTIAPLESFYVSVKLSFLTGFFAGAPVILYQAWKFISPGLYPSERKWVFPFVTLGTVFFFSGAAFGFFVVFPMVVSFLSEFNLEIVSSQYTLEKYVSFASLILISFGFVFEFPLVLTILLSIGLIQRKTLVEKRMFFYVIAFVSGAVLTPPDVISQCLLASVLIVFYEIVLLISKLTDLGNSSDRNESAEEKFE